MASEIQVIGVRGIPEVKTGDDIVSLIAEAGVQIEDGDILVVTQKIVSKAEGRVVRLADIKPSAAAFQLSSGSNRDPRLTEVILRETVRIVRMDGGNIICETRHGFKCANAGADASNVPGDDSVSLLPEDPDASAEKIRSGIKRLLGKEVAVIISDSFGRPWREGAVNVAIGVAGMNPVVDYRGIDDAHGRPMQTTAMAVADELAAAAEIAMGKVDGIPVAIVRGYPYNPPPADSSLRGSKALIRPAERDLFR